MKRILISRDELAARWGLTKETLKRMEKKGIISPIKLAPRVVRYDQAAIEAYEKECTLDRREP